MVATHAGTRLLLVSIALTVLGGLLYPGAAIAQSSSLREHSLDQDGLKRKFLLYTPRKANRHHGERPLVIVLHGGGGTHRGMVRLTKGRWNELADEHGFYVVYPNAMEKHWDFGAGLTSKKRKQRVDDLAFFGRVIDAVSNRAPIDESRVFATGISRGGQASYFLACKLSDRIRAIAPVAMSIPAFMEDDCVAGPPIGVAIFNGTHDPQVPYDGGPITVLGTTRDTILSTDQTVALWRSRNVCSNASGDAELLDKPGDKTRVTRVEWSDCAGAPLTLYRIENGGHTWPSGRQYFPVRLVGEVSQDIDGAEEAWKFFSQFSTRAETVDPDATASGGQLIESIAIPGYPKRPYDIFVPHSLDKPAPVLLVLHGGGADAANAIRTTCPGGETSHADCITNHAARNGYIAVFPRGTSRPLMKKMRSWNAGGGDIGKQWICTSGPACEKQVDDIGYFTALLDVLQNRADVDTQRVYATGISNGAAMVHRLACELSHRIAAIAAVEGANQASTVQGCTPGRAVPVLQIHGTADCAWPYTGGTPNCRGAGRLFQGSYVSVERSMGVWAAINGCSAGPSVSEIPDRFDDATRAARLAWIGCQAPLVGYRVEGGGHTWPNGYQYQPVRRIGAVTLELTNDDIWTFLSAQALPE